MRDWLTSANLPIKINRLTRKSFGPKASLLFDYLDSEAWQEDRAKGKVICLSGNPAIRTELLQLIAKGIALAGNSAYYVTLHQLIFMLEDDDGRRKLDRVDYVFVDQFEKDFGAGGCPYTFYQRASVEDFLSRRKAEEAKATFFATAKAWASGEWWSRDFVSEFSPMITDIILPA